MESPPVLTLPLEITDMITDFLFDDKRALANMSLVCRAFYPSARLHLFDTFTIPSDVLLKTTEAQLSDYVEIFASFAPLVHRLLIHGNNGITYGSLRHCTETFLPCFLIFKDVTSLSFEEFSWGLEEMENGVRSALFPCFSGLLELSFISCIFRDGADIIRLALQFPLLEQMHFENVESESDLTFANGPHDAVPSACSLSSLRSVAMGGHCSDLAPIIDGFLSLATIPLLRNIEITDIARHELVPAGQLIRALGPGLRHLTLGFYLHHTLRLGVYRSDCYIAAAI
jgi:hypothetical protein